MRFLITAAVVLMTLQQTFAADLAGKRKITTLKYSASAPLFVKSAKTLDPVAVSRQCWKGYLTKQPDPWGMQANGEPTLRFSFDNRALPWPVLKHHAVDGFDNNNRNLSAHAYLHDMLGAEKDNDPLEKGQIAYLLGCTDPIGGVPYSPDSLPRSCAVGHGELAKNLMLLYEQTKEPYLKVWASRMIKTLRSYASVKDQPGVGKIAFYCQGMFTVGDPPARETNDPTMGGWQHLAVGWNLWAFSKWYEVTGDKDSLDFAVALANRLCNSQDANGDDGSLRPDGSFGGKKQESSASWHMHGHTHCLPGLMHLGGQLTKAGRKAEALKFINQTSKTFDWLYDPTRNPDAGSMTGWLGEWLMTATGWPRKADCEGCTMGDVVQTAIALGDAGRLDPSLAGFTRYYDRAEQIYSSQVMEQMFRPTPRYLSVVKECIQKRVEKDLPSAKPEERAKEVQKRYALAVKTADRMVGQQLGTCGFPDWANDLKSDLDPDLPGIHMQGCCSDATIRASHAIWTGIVTGNSKETRVNMAFNRKSPLVDVVSCLPHRGELDVTIQAAKKLLVRVPQWAPRSEVKVYLNKKPVPVKWNGDYVELKGLKRGQLVTVSYPLRIWQVVERINGIDYTERWRGNTIVDINPPGKWVPMFQRPELDTEQVRLLTPRVVSAHP